MHTRGGCMHKTKKEKQHIWYGELIKYYESILITSVDLSELVNWKQDKSSTYFFIIILSIIRGMTQLQD